MRAVNLRDENVLRELNLYPLWVRRDAAQTSVNASTRHSGEGRNPVQTNNPRSGQNELESQPNSEFAPPSREMVNQLDSGLRRNDEVSAVEQSVQNPIGLNWPELKQKVKNCTACNLRAGCTQTVFGVGDEHAEWLFVGDWPAEDEETRSEPFVGQAGKLLDNMLTAIKLKRGNRVYIANVVKCRPPADRNPDADEIATCLPYLHQQIALIKPKLIVALGKTAASALLGRDATLGSLRGMLHDYQGIPLIVTFHPAYLLRSPSEKAKAWQDLCFALQQTVIL
jgi:DNA polymerase